MKRGNWSGRRGVRQIRARVKRALQASIEMLEPRVLLTNVLQWGGNPMGNAVYDTETVLTPENVNSSQFERKRLFSLPAADADQVYAQPLYVSNLTVSGQGTNNGLHAGVVIVATTYNNVYAFDTGTFARLWTLNLGPAIPQGAPNGPYLVNFSNTVGVIGTPVIDAATNLMYLNSTQMPSSGVYVHKVFAINITTGTVANVVTLGNVSGGIVPTVAGNTPDAVNGVVSFNPGRQMQRPGLTILNDKVYVAYGSYGNSDYYHGWVLGFDKATLGLTAVFNTVPNILPGNPGAESRATGSVWQSGASLTTDGTYLYLVTGNGIFDDDPAVGAWGEATLKLVPTNTTSANPTTNGWGLGVADYFGPWNATYLGVWTTDLDLGTSGALLLPDVPGPHPRLEIVVSKQGVVYVIDRDNMGQHNASTNNIVQEISLRGHGLFGMPTYFNGMVYMHPEKDTVQAFSLVNGLLSEQPVLKGSVTINNQGASLPISANGTSNGVVWQIETNTGTLNAYDAATLRRIYTTSVGSTVHFTVPTIADGKVFVGGVGYLAMYGLKASPFTSPPPVPTNLAQTNSIGGQVRLTWTSNATNESGFVIERSPNDTNNFMQIATVGVDATSFTDMNVTVGTTYHYRVRATNPFGNSAYTAVINSTPVTFSRIADSYQFEEGAGTDVADSGTVSPNNAGTLSGSITAPTWVPGRNGGSALSFNGVNGNMIDNATGVQGATVTTAVNLNTVLGSTSTMMAWIRTTQVGNDEPTQAPALAGATRLNNQISFPPTPVNTQDAGSDIRWGYIDASGRIGISVDGFRYVSHPGDRFGVTSTTAINDGEWHHVAFTRDSTTGLLRVYVDGVLEGSYFGNPGTKGETFNLLGAQIYRLSNGTVTQRSYFIGEMDDVRIYNQIVTAEEIALLGTVPDVPTGLVAVPASSTSIQLTWNAVPGASAIEIVRREGTSGSFMPLVSLAGSANSYTDAGLTTGTEYFYAIRAGAFAGTSNFTDVVSAIAGGGGSSTVTGRWVFYNNSYFDGNNAAANAGDDAAIAIDKSALLPGQAATFANYTSYDKGINGVMVDVSGVVASVTAVDFELRVGNEGDPATWPTVSASAITTRAMGGGTRITLTFADGTIVGNWLRVKVQATANTGLASANVFYFGNAPGETGNAVGDARVNAVDEILARANSADLTGLALSVAIQNVYDFNRDGAVNAADEAVAGANYTYVLNDLDLILAPAAPLAVVLSASPGPAPVVSTKPASDVEIKVTAEKSRKPKASKGAKAEKAAETLSRRAAQVKKPSVSPLLKMFFGKLGR